MESSQKGSHTDAATSTYDNPNITNSYTQTNYKEQVQDQDRNHEQDQHQVERCLIIRSRADFVGSNDSMSFKIPGRANGCHRIMRHRSTQTDSGREIKGDANMIPWRLTRFSQRQIQKRNRANKRSWHETIEAFRRENRVIEKDFTEEITRLDNAVECYKMPRRRIGTTSTTSLRELAETSAEEKEEGQHRDVYGDKTDIQTGYDPDFIDNLEVAYNFHL